MTDQLKKTKRQQAVDAVAMSEMRDGSTANQVLGHIEGITDVLKYTADRFNAMRIQLSAFCDLVRNQDSEALKYVIMSKALAQGDFGLLLDEESKKPATYEVEDAGEFTKCIKEIEATKRYDTRMQVCVRVSRLIADAISRWESKEDKMKSMSSLCGSTKSELEIARKKIVQFREAINILKKRGSMVSQIYYDTKKQILDFVKKMNEEFYTVNYNEGTEK